MAKKNISTQKRLMALALAGISILAGSCNFEEDCPERGKIKAYIESHCGNAEREEKPGLHYFPHRDVKEQAFFMSADVMEGDTLLRESPTGTFDLVLFQKGNNLLRTPSGNDYTSMRLECPKTSIGGNVYLMELQEYICSGFLQSVQVRQWQTTPAPFVMKPLVKEIAISVHVIDDASGSPIRRIVGYLTGVVSSKNPCTHANGIDYGTQVIPMNAASDGNHQRQLYVFGINGAVSNILLLEGEDMEGRKYLVETDVSRQLRHLNDEDVDSCTIHLEVRFKPQMNFPSVIIEKWDEVGSSEKYTLNSSNNSIH